MSDVELTNEEEAELRKKHTCELAGAAEDERKRRVAASLAEETADERKHRERKHVHEARRRHM